MNIRVINIGLGMHDIYGIEIFCFEFKNVERALFSFCWSPRVAIWIDIMFLNKRIEL